MCVKVFWSKSMDVRWEIRSVINIRCFITKFLRANVYKSLSNCSIIYKTSAVVSPYRWLLPHIHTVKVSLTIHKTKLAVSSTHQFPPRGGKNHPGHQMARLEMVLFMIQQCLFVALAFQIMPLSSLHEHVTQFFLLVVHQINELGGLWSFLSFAAWIVFHFRNNK